MSELSLLLGKLAILLTLWSQSLNVPEDIKLGAANLRGADTIVYCLPGNKTPIAKPVPSASVASLHNATSTWVLLGSPGAKRDDYIPLSTTTPRMVPIYDYMYETHPNVKAYLNSCP